MLSRHYPQIRAEVVPHDYRPPIHAPAPAPPTGEITVALVGAMGPEKGGVRVERLATLTRKQGLPIRWLVIGDTIHYGGPQAVLDGALFVHGGYDRHDLPDLLARYGVHLVAFPADGPETWSLTLDEAWACRTTALVPELGALGERVRATGAGWRVRDWQSDTAWLEWLVWLVTEAGQREWAAVAERVRHTHDQIAAAPPVTRLYERFTPERHRQAR
ncbi:MAG: hypothetical protein U5L11_00240 [Arhodomonas sp.]|nr:hypothetical protein [Arhodomonas sp.]